MQFLLVCPSCEGAATGLMQAGPHRGDSREMLVRWAPRRIVCRCGLNRELPEPYDPNQAERYGYRLYLRGQVRGHELWTPNENHARQLRLFIAENRPVTERLDGWYDLPKWMLLANNRGSVLKCLDRLIALAQTVSE